jgi:hypothetical protein
MKIKARWSWVGALALAVAIASLAPQARIFAQQTSFPPTTIPGLPGSPPIELTQEQRISMARRMEIEGRMFMMQPNQQVEARLLDPLSDDQLRNILADLDRTAADATRSGTPVLPAAGRPRDRMELAWHSGRLARDGAYPPESRIPEGKAVETVLTYAPTAGPQESWPPILLPNLSPPIDHGMGRNPVPLLYEMRVDAKADGTMEFAILASMGSKKMLVPGIKVKSGGIASVLVPGGHVLSIHATLRDQTAMEKEALQRVAAARAQGQEAVNILPIDLFSIFTGPPPAVIETMRTTQRGEAAIRGLGARP